MAAQHDALFMGRRAPPVSQVGTLSSDDERERVERERVDRLLHLREQREVLEILRVQAGEAAVAGEVAVTTAAEGVQATQKASALVRANVAAVGRNVRGIAAGVGRLEGTAGKILSGLRGITQRSREEGWIKTIVSSQLLMFMILFMTHTQFPITSETISIFYFNIMRFTVPIQIFNRIRTGTFQATVGGVIYEFSPLILTQIALQYTKDLSEARRNTGVAGNDFRTLWQGTAEASMLEFFRLPFSEMALTSLPSGEAIYASVLEEVTSKWDRFRGLVKDNEDPAVIAQMIVDYMNRKLSVTVNGVAHTLGVDRLWYQGSTFAISLRVIGTWLFDMLKTTIGPAINAFILTICSLLYFEPSSSWLPTFDMRDSCKASWDSFYSSGGGKSHMPKTYNKSSMFQPIIHGIYGYKDRRIDNFAKNIGEYMYLVTQLEIKGMFDPVFKKKYERTIQTHLHDGLLYQLIILQSYNKTNINMLTGYLLIEPRSLSLMSKKSNTLTITYGGNKQKRKRVTKKKGNKAKYII